MSLTNGTQPASQIDFHISPPRSSTQIPATWEAMIQVEPRLIDLERLAKQRRRSRQRWLAYHTLRRDVERLVGWHSKRPELASSAHYEVAVDRIAQAMGI